MTATPRLTARQRQIVELLSQGLTYGQIATKLGVRTITVRVHIKTIAVRLPGPDTPRERVLKHLPALLGT